MGVVSQPLRELVGGGKDAKAVRECTELYLGCRGIERLAGFEGLVNLEVLWLEGNCLTALHGLDANVRLRELYAHDNQICTIRGSLARFQFLHKLDLSNNQLSDLEQVLKGLSRLGHLTHLNLKGNRCCEEPGYRLAMIHTLPSLVVLDLHYVTPSERRQAAQLAGPGAAASALAFLQKAPARDPRAARVGKYSTLEQELQQTVAASHASQQHQQPGCTHGNAAGGGEQSSGASGWTARTSQLQPAHGTHAAATAPLCSGQQSHYMPKDTLVLHTHAGAGASTALQQRPGATTAAQRSGFCGSTFSQRLADSSWQLSKRTIKL